MENSFQTSFIPKKPIVENGVNISSDDKKTTSIFIVVTVLILIVMILSTGGLYLYKEYLNKNIGNLKSDLFKISKSFDQDTIMELETYDKRTKTARQVLGSHIVLTPLFELIGKLTLSSIQYTKFDHSTSNGNFSVKMSGIARDYRSIALQADVFNTKEGSVLKDVIFSNLTKNKNNYVVFDVEFNVDPSFLSYSNNISNMNTNVANIIDTSDTNFSNTVSNTTNNTPTDDLNRALSTSPDNNIQ